MISAFVVHKLVGDEIEVYKLNKKPEEGGGYTGKFQVINSYAWFLAPNLSKMLSIGLNF